MVPKEQLRINNLVVLAHESNAPIYEVEEIRKEWVFLKGAPRYYIYDDLMPVELSDEWLERLGFEKNLGGYYMDIPEIGCMSFDDDTLELGVSTKYPITLAKTHIKYLHALQNLFYSLTGKELTIKEPING